MDSASTIRLVRELRIVDEATIKTLDQLFAGNLNDDLLDSLVTGREGPIALALYKVVQASTAGVRSFVLRFLANLSQVCRTFAKEFTVENAVEKFGSEPAAVFLDIAIQNADNVAVTSAALHLSANVIRSASGSIARYEATIQRFFGHVQSVLKEEELNASNIEYPIHACSQLVRRKAIRPYFLNSGIVEQIPRILTEACATDSSALIQLSYETLLICWLLSFEFPCIVALHKVKIIPTIHRVLQRLQKEKCIRVALLTLRNFAEAQLKYYNLRHGTIDLGFAETMQLHVLGEINNGKGPNFFADMIGVGLVKTLWQLARRKFGDDDIAKEIEEMTTLLDQNLEQMSSYTEYKGEVQSGVLEWSPVHTSTKFWRENASKFEENNYEVLSSLRDLVVNSHNDLTLAVACYDIGELVRHHPSGRALLQLPQLANAKEKIMHLMSHKNSEVSKNALLAVQKIMVQRWEFIK
jgi:V-type H+-transporting ATPase subunit H